MTGRAAKPKSETTESLTRRITAKSESRSITIELAEITEARNLRIAPKLILGHMDGHVGQIQYSGDPPTNCGVEVVLGLHYLVGKTPISSTGACDPLAGKNHLASSGCSDLMNEPGRRSPRKRHTQFDLRYIPKGISRGDPEIRTRRETTTPTDCVAMDPGDGDRLTILYCPRCPAPELLRIAPLTLAAHGSSDLLAIGAGAKRLAPASENHNPHFVSGIYRIEQIADFLDHQHIVGVACLGPVEPDMKDRSFEFQFDRLKVQVVDAHGLSLTDAEHLVSRLDPAASPAEQRNQRLQPGRQR
jgi:hypothetical protein